MNFGTANCERKWRCETEWYGRVRKKTSQPKRLGSKPPRIIEGKQTASSLEELQNSKHSEEDVVDSLICHKD